MNTPAPTSFGFRPRSGNILYDYDLNVTPGLLEEGVMVRQRQELIRLPDISKMIAEIKVGEGRVRQVRAGMAAYIRVENIPDRRFKGTVRHVALLPDAQAAWMNPDVKVFPTDILVEDELPELKPGVSVRAEVIITNLTKVLSVPIQTVARWRGENVCFVKRGSGVAPVPVMTGWFNDRYVEVTSGLREGDKILLAPMSDEAMQEESAGGTNDVETSVIETNQPAEARPNNEERRSGDVRRRQRGEDPQ
jgi:multidrug efflux pump subunit AcrA (membrane-fusion protein)